MNANAPPAVVAANGTKTKPAWRFVNTEMIDTMWRIYHTDVAVTACRNVLQNRLLSLGLMFMFGENLPAKEFYTHVQREFVPFCKTVIDCIHVQGFCPFTVDPVRKVPVVLHHHMGRIGYRFTEFGGLEYGFIKHNETNASPNVFFVREHDVAYDGRITSPMSTYFRSRVFCDAFERNAIAVDTFTSNPPIYTESSSKTMFSDEDLLEIGPADDPVRGSLHAERLKRESYTANLHKMQQNMSRMLNAHHVDTGEEWWRRKIDPVTGLPNFDNQSERDTQPVIPLPSDTRAANVTMPHSRHDLLAIRQDTIEHACLVMGVPPSVLRHTNAAHSASVTSALTMLDATLNRLRSTLTFVLEDLYELIFLTTEGHAAGMGDITIIFPGMEHANVYKDLYSTGILTYEAYTRFLQRYYALRRHDFAQSPFQRNEIPGINAVSTTGLVHEMTTTATPHAATHETHNPVINPPRLSNMPPTPRNNQTEETPNAPAIEPPPVNANG